MILGALTKDECEMLRKWRNTDIDAYRTPFLLTAEMQEDFHREVICSRTAPHRYWAVRTPLDMALVGAVGLVNISWENRHAEISIVVNPEKRSMGYGEKALKLLLEEGFFSVGMENIYGECYKSSKSYTFWCEMVKKYNLYSTILPARKFCAGVYWDSLYFNFNKGSIVDYS